MKTLRFAVAVALLAASRSNAQQPSASLTLIGENGTSKTLSMAELAALPQKEFKVDAGESAGATFRGPTVRSLANLVGAPTGMGFRGPAMMLAIVAECADGYKVAYTLSELDEQFGNKLALLALTEDGKPLDAKTGPLRTVVQGDDHRARWARQVVRLRIVRIGG